MRINTLRAGTDAVEQRDPVKNWKYNVPSVKSAPGIFAQNFSLIIRAPLWIAVRQRTRKIRFSPVDPTGSRC